MEIMEKTSRILGYSRKNVQEASSLEYSEALLNCQKDVNKLKIPETKDLKEKLKEGIQVMSNIS